MRRMSRKGKAAVFVALLMLCIGMFLGMNTDVMNLFQVEAATTKGVVTVSSLNVRKGPGTEYDLVTQDGKAVYLFQDDQVKILDEQNNFYKVRFTYNKKTVNGYSSKAYIKLILSATPTVKPTATPKKTAKPKTTTKPKATAKATSKPKTTTKPKATSAPSEVIIEDDVVPNSGVKTNTKTVKGLKLSGKVTASALRVRTKPSTSADELVYKNKKVRLYKGDKVTIQQQKIIKGVVWYYVQFTFEKKTLKGYVLSDYIKLTFAESVKGKIYSTSKVYVRNTAGVSDDYLLYEDKKVSLKDGKAVKVIKEANANSKKWLRISFSYDGETLKGYVLANLVAFQATPATPTPSPTVKPTATPKTTTKPKATATVKPTTSPDNTNGSRVKGEVNNGPLKVRVGAGTDCDRLIYNGEYVNLPIGHSVDIIKEVAGETEDWYYVEFSYNDIDMKGYVMAQYVTKMESETTSGSSIG